MVIGPNFALKAAKMEIYLEWNNSYRGPLWQCYRDGSDTWVYLGPLEIIISRVGTQNVEELEAGASPSGGVPQD